MSSLRGNATDFEAWALSLRGSIDARLLSGLTALSEHAVAQKSPLLDAMRHGVMNGGKRIRALAVLAAGQLAGAPQSSLLTVAAALEYMHAYSLIHDDLPCMDDDDLRRGQPTVHVVYGQAQALLAGDALQTLAFSTLSDAQFDINDAVKVQLIRALADASGVAGMAGGQAIDLHHVGQNLSQADMQTMHRLKTGALLHTSLTMGALCGSYFSQNDALNSYAQTLGLLFQVVDDILDASQNTAVLGKTAGKDAAADKPTYVKYLGIDGARDYAQKLYAQSIETLQPLGDKAQRLADLAAYCTQRLY